MGRCTLSRTKKSRRFHPVRRCPASSCFPVACNSSTISVSLITINWLPACIDHFKTWQVFLPGFPADDIPAVLAVDPLASPRQKQYKKDTISTMSRYNGWIFHSRSAKERTLTSSCSMSVLLLRQVFCEPLGDVLQAFHTGSGMTTT